MLEYLIKNITIIDGTNTQSFVGNIGIKGDEIAYIGSALEPAQQTIDGTGLYAAPGFIDVHTHDDIVFDQDPYNKPKLMQGVTTVVVGNCGFGVAPAVDPWKQTLIDYSTPILGEGTKDLLFDSVADYMSHLDNIPKGINVAVLAAHGPISIGVGGFDGIAMNDDLRRQTAAYVKDAMDAGAVGLSLGLMYAPGTYSSQQDIKVLAEVVAEAGGILTIHLKSESDNFHTSVEQAVELSNLYGTKVQISHLKHVGKEYWGQMKDNIKRLEEHLENGADLSFDMYPYTFGSTTMSILFPPKYLRHGVSDLLEQLKSDDVREDISRLLTESWGDVDNLSLLCGYENLFISSVDSKENEKYIGKTLEELGEIWGIQPDQAMMKLYHEENGQVAILLRHISPDDLEETMKFSKLMVASDGLPGAKLPHPRHYGSFPKFFRDYVIDSNLVSWQEAIHRITKLPADRFLLEKRGALAQGNFADIVVFDPDEIRDTATFEEPRQYPEGIKYIFVNGVLTVRNGETQPVASGRCLKRGQSR